MRASKLLGSVATALVLCGAGAARAADAPAAATAPAPVAAPAAEVKKEEPKKAKNPWRGSELSYEHGFSALSLSKSADPWYNPYYAHRWSIAPQWWVGDYLFFKAKLDMEQELTNSDDTTYKHEVLLSDLLLEVGTSGYTESVTGIKIGGNLRFAFPTSKQSQAATMRLAIAPSLNLSRKFNLLEGLVLGYGARFGIFFHKFTTAQANSPWLPCGEVDSIQCAQFVQTGVRNQHFSLSHGPVVGLEVLPGLTIEAAYAFLYGFLYPLSGQGDYLADDLDQSTRYAQSFSLGLSYAPVDFLGISLAAQSTWASLQPNGTYRTPFFNRNTQIGLGLSVSVDPLISKFTD